MISRYISAMVLLFVFAAGCSNEIKAPDAVSSLPPQPQTPSGLTASVGDGLIGLNWTVGNAAAVIRYKVYYSDSTSNGAGMRFLDSTTQLAYSARNLVNGRTYFFRVSAVSTSGLEGDKSGVVSSVPGIFAVNIAAGKKYTNTRQVPVGLTAPSGTSLVQLSEDSSFNGAQWDSYSSSKSFELSDGDGSKRLFARFQLTTGGASVDSVWDDIILDRFAAIDSVNVSTGAALLSPREVVKFSLYTSEAGGTASISISGLSTIPLNDDGMGGDATAGDKIYSADFTVPTGTELTDVPVVGKFTDAAGNSALDRQAATLFNVSEPPLPVTLSGYTISSLETMLEWTKSTISDFAGYRLFRDTLVIVSDSSHLVQYIQSQATTNYRDTGLAESTMYFYRLYVYDTRGAKTGSSVVSVTTDANQSPDTVTLAVSLTSTALTTSVSWSQADAFDFKSYNVLRSTSTIGAYDPSKIINIVNNRSTTSFDDTVPNSGQYYYRVFVVDKQGKMTGSNVVAVTVP